MGLKQLRYRKGAVQTNTHPAALLTETPLWRSFKSKSKKNIIISQKFLKRILKCWLSHDELRKFQTLVAYYAMMYIDLQILFFCFKII